MDVTPTIHIDSGPRDIIRKIGSQEKTHAGNIHRAPGPAKRDLRNDCIDLLLRDLTIEDACLRQSRAHSVCSYAELTELTSD